MVPKEIEMILARQLASYLAMPIFLVDQNGTLVFYNDPAESILGRRYEETGEMPASEWSTLFNPTDEHGNSIDPDDLPLVVALTRGRPAFRSIWIRGLDGVTRRIEIVAFPLLGQVERRLGAIALFCEVKE